MSLDFGHYAQKLNELLGAATPFVTVTIVELRGSAPQIQGAKAMVTMDGIVAGTVGGGKVEARAIAHAQEMLCGGDGKTCELLTWNLQTDVGMTCGGEVKLFFEVSAPSEWSISVFGAGHIAQSLVPILLQLHCKVTCLDQRAKWLSQLAPHPRLESICSDDLPSQVRDRHPKTFFVLMTQGHATDLPVLAEILQTRDAPYVGVIGSRQKAQVLRRNLKEMGLPSAKIDSFFCPMGLPIGNNTPPEISISVAAHLIQERDRWGVLQHKTKSF